MSTINSWGLIGFGNIGHEVVRQLALPKVAARLGLHAAPEFIINSKGVLGPDGQPSKVYANFEAIKDLPDVLFIALPSSDDGKLAYSYIARLLKTDTLVVTAEKGALANNFLALKQASHNFDRLGVSATVGGGTRLLHIAREYAQDIDNITQIHLALNGTLAAILSWCAPLHGSPQPLDEAVEKAVKLGYAEPGSQSPYDVIRGEAEGDIPKKAAIFCNILGLGRTPIDWKSFRFKLSEAELKQAVDPKQPHRFIVSLYSPQYQREHLETDTSGVVGGFKLDYSGWQIMGGFRRVDNLLGDLANLSGPGNGMVIGLGPHAADGIYAVTGPGAGVNPTVNAMLDDYIRLKRLPGNNR